MSDNKSGTLTIPNADELVARLAALAPVIKEHAASGETNRRVAPEPIEALMDAGAFKTCVPTRYGGYALDFRSLLKVSKAVGESDGGTSWVVTLANLGSWLAGLFPHEAQDEVFGSGTQPIISGVVRPTATSRRVPGGFRVTGRWYYNSASWYSNWAVLGVPLMSETGELIEPALVLVPRSDYRIEETWFVAGMSSSASNCVVVDDIFVPEHRIMSTLAAIQGRYPALEAQTDPIYRSAILPVTQLALVGPQLGMGQAALDQVVEQSSRKPISYTIFDRQQDSVAFQLKVAEAAMRLETAHLHAFRAAADIDEHALRGEQFDRLGAARVRADTGWTVDQVTQAMEALLSAHGAGSFAESNPLQRFWRDSAVAARHAAVLPMTGYEVYGKALLGVEEEIERLA